jgi:hypothetical protein
MPMPVVGTFVVVVGAVSVDGAVVEPAVVVSVPLDSVPGWALVVVVSSAQAGTTTSAEIKA